MTQNYVRNQARNRTDIASQTYRKFSPWRSGLKGLHLPAWWVLWRPDEWTAAWASCECRRIGGQGFVGLDGASNSWLSWIWKNKSAKCRVIHKFQWRLKSEILRRNIFGLALSLTKCTKGIFEQSALNEKMAIMYKFKIFGVHFRDVFFQSILLFTSMILYSWLMTWRLQC